LKHKGEKRNFVFPCTFVFKLEEILCLSQSF
jgi:hypothetical protein